MTTVDFWQKNRNGWHVLAVAAVVAVDILVWATVDPLGPRIVAVTLIAAILGWYALVGAKVLRCGGERRAMLYLGGVAVLLLGVYPITMSASFLLFMLNPQLFAMIDSWWRRVVAMVLLYSEIIFWTIRHEGWNTGTLSLLGLIVVLPAITGAVVGAFITGIINQSRQRAELIEELLRTRAELAAERHEAGVHAERERLAAEIHDTLAQGFTSILMLSQAAQAGLHRSPDAVGGQLDLIERAARENLAEARALVGALTPPDLTDGNLVEAFGRLAERHTRDTGVPVSVNADGCHEGASQAVDVVLLRAVQEALTNVRRHADASMVRIEFCRDDDRAVVTVIDDGHGFDPARRHEGYGLPGLRSRATAYGGTCAVTSSLGGGTTVRVSIPEGSV